MKKPIKINDFKPNQEVYIKLNGQFLEGVISDKKCAAGYKFKNKPVQYRNIIPVIWKDNSVGAIPHTELKIIQKLRVYHK